MVETSQTLLEWRNKLIKSVIFDLDDTALLSKHRQRYLPNGDLDLDHWEKNSNYENIMQDSVLPLAKVWKQLLADGWRITVLTARVMSQGDYDVLAKHGLAFHQIMSRNGISKKHYNMSDADYKLKHLKKAKIDLSKTLMFDDNAKVKGALRRAGLTVLCAHKVNKRLRK